MVLPVGQGNGDSKSGMGHVGIELRRADHQLTVLTPSLSSDEFEYLCV